VAKLKIPLIIFLLFIAVPSFLLVKTHLQRERDKVLGEDIENNYQLMKNYPIVSFSIEKTINLGKGKRLAQVYHVFDSISGLAVIDYADNFIEWLPIGKPFFRDDYFPVPGEILDWLRFDNLGGSAKDGGTYLLAQFANTGTAGVHPFYVYSYGDSGFRLILNLVESSSTVEIGDLNDDIKDEIIHDYSIAGIGKIERDLLRWKDIWRLEGETPVRVNSLFPQEYQSLINLYDLALTKKEWVPDVTFYYPVIRCLKGKAELTIKNNLVGPESCLNKLKQMLSRN